MNSVHVGAGGKMWLEDAACNRLAELALNDVEVAGSILKEAVSCSAFAVQAVASRPDVHRAFQKGLRASLEATLHIKGLLEMMFDVLSGWIEEFISGRTSLPLQAVFLWTAELILGVKITMPNGCWMMHSTFSGTSEVYVPVVCFIRAS